MHATITVTMQTTERAYRIYSIKRPGGVTLFKGGAFIGGENSVVFLMSEKLRNYTLIGYVHAHIGLYMRLYIA